MGPDQETPPPPEPASSGKARACPICGRPASLAAHPFCSKRCADIDLNRWLGGVYAVPAAPTEEDDE